MHYLGNKKTRVYTDNMSFKYFALKVQASPNELRQFGVIVLMDIELIHKLSKNNLVLDIVSRTEEFMEVKFNDTVMLSMIIYYNDSPFIKDLKKAYKIDKDALEIKKAFAPMKSIIKQKRLIEASSIRDGFI